MTRSRSILLRIEMQQGGEMKVKMLVLHYREDQHLPWQVFARLDNGVEVDIATFMWPADARAYIRLNKAELIGTSIY
jgi:hypothetical protein